MVKTRESAANSACCRLCRGTDLRETWNILEDDLVGKITAFATVQIHENDRLTKIICRKCRDLVLSTHRFKRQVEKSDRKLRQALLRKSSKVSQPRVLLENIDMIETTIAYLKKNNQNFYKSVRDRYGVKHPTRNTFFNPLAESDNFKEGKTEANEKLTKNGDVSSSEDSNQNNDEKPLILRTKRHECNYCLKSFANVSLLEKHSAIHRNQPEKVYICYLCDEKFSSVEKVKNHAAEIHDFGVKNERLNENCDTEKESSDKSDSERDTKNSKTKKNSKYSCKFCGRSFTYYKSFLAHLENHPDDYNKLFMEISKSPKIVETAARVLNLNKPLTNSNSNTANVKPNYSIGSVKTVSNQESFTKIPSVLQESKSDVKDDANTESSNNFKCKKGSQNENDDSIVASNLVCNECGKIFSSRGNLKRHISTHTGLRQSTSCSADSDNEPLENTSSEYIKKKITKQLRPYKCTLCKKAFAQYQSLENHLARHKRDSENPRRFLCEICSKVFSQSGSLSIHMKTHSNIKPYVCDVCDRAFTKKTYLRLHLRIHSGEKPYSCRYCNKNFARANTLARHLTVHTGEAKYQCKICLKSFRRLTSLNEHTYTHTGQRPYACKICSKSYNNAGSLYAHTKKCQKKNPSAVNYPVSAPEPLQPIENNFLPQEDFFSPSSQILIFSNDKVDEMITDEVVAMESSCQFFITNLQASPIDILEPFPITDSDIYNMNSKSFRTAPDYEIFQSL